LFSKIIIVLPDSSAKILQDFLLIWFYVNLRYISTDDTPNVGAYFEEKKQDFVNYYKIIKINYCLIILFKID